jgi:rRNA maturation endonuclease Nob1
LRSSSTVSTVGNRRGQINLSLSSLSQVNNMAYYRDLQTSCEAKGCQKWAVLEVLDVKGRPHGKFCRECGRRTILRLNRQEEEENARRKSVSRR